MQIEKVSKQSIQKAINFLKSGKAVAYPTDTSYGLAVDAMNETSVKSLYKIKERGFKKPVYLVVSSLAMAGKFAKVDARARKLAKKFLPGALTLLLPLRHPLNLPLMRGRSSGGQSRLSQTGISLLSAGTGKIGIRIPKNKIALELVKKLGWPITATSANISGQPDNYSTEDIMEQFKNKKYQPDLILDGGKLKKVRPSTIIDLTHDKPKLIRKGPISFKKVVEVLK